MAKKKKAGGGATSDASEWSQWEEELTALADALIEGRSFPSLQGLGPVTPRSDAMRAQAPSSAGPRSHSQAG